MIHIATIRQPIKYFVFCSLIMASLLMIASSVSLASSPPATIFEKNYGGSQDQTGYQVWQTEDNGFIIVGSGPDSSGSGTNLYLTKVVRT